MCKICGDLGRLLAGLAVRRAPGHRLRAAVRDPRGTAALSERGRTGAPRRRPGGRAVERARRPDRDAARGRARPAHRRRRAHAGLRVGQRRPGGRAAQGAGQSATGSAEIDGVLSGYRWSGTVTYSFPDAGADYASGYGYGEPTAAGFAQISAAQQTASHAANLLDGGAGSDILPAERATTSSSTAAPTAPT